MQITDIQIDQNQRETTIHGSYDFPLAVYRDQLDKNVRGFVDWHWHEEIQLSLVTEGEVAFSVNQNTYKLKKGQGIFINSGCLHMARPLTRPDSAYICVNAAPRLLTFFPGSAIEQKYIQPFLKPPGFSAVTLDPAADWQKLILTKTAEIHDLYSQKAFGYELDIGLALAAVWRQLIARQQETLAAAKPCEYIDQQRIKTIMAYIHQHYAEKLSLRAVAALVNISESECCRFFKRAVKCTVFEYIMSYRINRSIQLLKTTDLTISQIADSVGFGTASYYIGSFKKQVSCTPKEYRKNLAHTET